MNRSNQAAVVLAAFSALALAVSGLLTVAACGSPGTVSWYSAHGRADAANPDATNGATISSPADHAQDVPASAEITFATHNAVQVRVVLTDSDDGQTVDGAMRTDGSSWVPQQALKYRTNFTVEITSTDGAGGTYTHRSTFTTMDEPDDTDGLASQMGDNQQYGVGAPIVLNFSKPIPAKQRAAVQRRLFVQTTPPQEGAWNWFDDTEVHYRPKDYWEPGTKISLRALFGGLPLGNGLYGGNDITVDASIVPHDLRIGVDDSTKTMTVTQDGKVIKTMPVSMGKQSTPSSTGNMVIMTKNAEELFDSANDGIGPDQPGYYKQIIDDALRLTWGGQYIHSAPWSVDDQGHDDISHGCVNLSPENAQWLFDNVHVGDPVNIRNTGAPLDWGDGWTDWNVSWTDYLRGSAIPYDPDSGITGMANAAPTASPSPSPSDSPNAGGDQSASPDGQSSSDDQSTDGQGSNDSQGSSGDQNEGD